MHDHFLGAVRVDQRIGIARCRGHVKRGHIHIDPEECGLLQAEPIERQIAASHFHMVREVDALAFLALRYCRGQGQQQPVYSRCRSHNTLLMKGEILAYESQLVERT